VNPPPADCPLPQPFLHGRGQSEHLGRQFVIDNRTGAAGNIATEAVVRASPDGYTLLMVGSANAINAPLYEKLSFNLSAILSQSPVSYARPSC
jgi:tripartite-type tricarboxylate transporter receptor subunit TctC